MRIVADTRESQDPSENYLRSRVDRIYFTQAVRVTVMPTRRSPSLSPLQILKLVRHLPQFAKLFWRLFRDQRVPFRAKAVLIGALLYVLLPTDLLPDIIPFVGVADDITVLLLAGRWFLSLCPSDVVQEHVTTLSEEAAD